MTKQQWTELFEAIGLTEEQMWVWHRQFEARHPEDHASFLRWLNIDESECHRIRQRARG